MNRLVAALVAGCLLAASVPSFAAQVDDDADTYDLVVLAVQKRDPSVKPVLESLSVQGGGHISAAATASDTHVAAQAGISQTASAATPALMGVGHF